jgi:hypothetical protein
VCSVYSEGMTDIDVVVVQQKPYWCGGSIGIGRATFFVIIDRM